MIEEYEEEILVQDLGVEAWSPSLDEDLDPLIGEWWVGPACAWSTSGACVSGYTAGHIDSRIAG